MNKNFLLILAPIILFFILIFLWELLLSLNNIPHYIVPKPSLVVFTLYHEWENLFPALVVTTYITLLALFLAVILGILSAIIISEFKIIEISLMPYTVVLQVTPIIAIAIISKAGRVIHNAKILTEVLVNLSLGIKNSK